ncbi:MAG TPA: glycosyltransferase family 2 protein [Acidimicrobiia bacterium]|nr:glycosyltransferase family 2 protein [Acidimicrobiia bacterium]
MDQPSVDVIVPAKDAGQTIRPALEAVNQQTYRGVGSVVVAASDLGTAAVARECGAVVVNNPTGRTPIGLNLALAQTTAEVIARVDAHAVIPPGYLARAVQVLVDTGADTVGGMQVPLGSTASEKAIAAAMSSRLGAGDARYRIGGKAGPADTVYLGVFLRSTLERLGGYDEHFDRNQDYELNQRIRDSGGIVWFDPGLEVSYRPRGSLIALARQYFDYGRWKREFARRHPGSLRLRQLAPPMLVTGLFVAIVAGFWWPWAWLAVAAYVVLLALFGLTRLPSIGPGALLIPLALATMHSSWGLGFLVGRTRRDTSP